MPRPLSVLSWPANHGFDETLECRPRIFRAPGVDGRHLDDRAAWRDQPAKAPPGRQRADRSGIRPAGADDGNRREAVAQGVEVDARVERPQPVGIELDPRLEKIAVH